jgi:hypothetical protein
MTTAAPADKLTARIARISDAMLITTLRNAESTLNDMSPRDDDRPHWNLVRARLITEVEKRWPQAAAAVEAAYLAEDTAIEAGEATTDVDYVGVLLGAIPQTARL